MKKVILSATLLVSLISMVVFSNGAPKTKGPAKEKVETTVTSTARSKSATFDLGPLYWFDITDTWTGAYYYRDYMELLTGFDHYHYSPFTIQLKGYFPWNVGYYENGAPYVLLGSHPDVYLFTHP